MFQSQDRSSALLVVAHDGARPVEVRRVCQASRATRVASRIQLEGQTATVAHRPIEKLDLLPALRTQGAGTGDLFSARHAKRGKQKIDQRQNICSIAPRICRILAQWPTDRRAFSTAMPSHCIKRVRAQSPARCFSFGRLPKDWRNGLTQYAVHFQTRWN